MDDIIYLQMGTDRQLKYFLKLLNSLSQNICFTMETENKHSLNFLDISIPSVTKIRLSYFS